ncbi:MAG TPA: lipopolysaccharide biosynthesis protein [Methylomirabilota bacterium]|nr:lipopolysaccharide biosynthesis protein [Methylomirabilota bacterium]
MRRGNLGRKSLLLVGSTWGHSALALLVSVMIARRLGPAAVGMIALNLGFTGLVMAALVPGFAQAHLKRLAEGQDPGRCLGTMLAIQTALTALLVPAVALAWTRLGTREEALVFVFMLGAQVSGRFSDVYLRVFLSRELVVPHAAIMLGARVARLVLTVAVLIWLPQVTAVAATFWLEGLLAAGAAAVLLASRYGVRPARPTRASVAGYWSYARPFFVTTPIALVQDSIDRFLVGRWAGLTAAGHYHVARALWEVLASVMAPPGVLLFTRLSSLYATRSAERDRQARELFFRGMDKVLFLTTTLAVGFWALARPVITALYGEPFADAATALRIFVLAAIAANVVNPYTFVIQAQDQNARFIPVNVLRLAVYLGCLALLVPVPPLIPPLPGGDAGAATARLLLILFPAWVYVRWTRELAGIPFYRPAALYALAFALAVGVYGVTRVLARPLGEPASLALSTAIAFAVHLLVLLVAHPGTRDNLREARSLLSPRQFRDLVRSGFGDR